MCFYIGIEDLAANAIIEIQKKKKMDGSTRISIALGDLEDYGTAVVDIINRKKANSAMMVLSRSATAYMFRNYADYFEEIEEGWETAIRLREGKTADDLISTFRAYKASDLIQAYAESSAVEILYEKYKCYS